MMSGPCQHIHRHLFNHSHLHASLNSSDTARTDFKAPHSTHNHRLPRRSGTDSIFQEPKRLEPKDKQRRRDAKRQDKKILRSCGIFFIVKLGNKRREEQYRLDFLLRVYKPITELNSIVQSGKSIYLSPRHMPRISPSMATDDACVSQLLQTSFNIYTTTVL